MIRLSVGGILYMNDEDFVRDFTLLLNRLQEQHDGRQLMRYPCRSGSVHHMK